jgi:hypothetical protein
MKTYRLEKAKIYNDGTLGVWETSKHGGTDEIWHDYDQALASAERRDNAQEDGCQWRVEGDEHW